MRKGCSQIAWGLAFALINVRIQYFDLFPDAVGYVLLLLGLGRLAPFDRAFGIARMAAWPLLVGSVLQWFGLRMHFSLTGNASIGFRTMLASSVGVAVSLVMMYGICRGLENLAKANGNASLAESARRCWYGAAFFTLGMLFVIPFNLNAIGSELLGLQLFLTFGSFVTDLFILIVVRRAGRELGGDGEGNGNDDPPSAGGRVDLIA